MALNTNAQAIHDYIVSRNLASIEENLNYDGSINWSFVEADVVLDHADETNHVPFYVCYDDIDAALNVLANS